ncbi:MAG TPA: TetR/AcrR family transcriptional regulator [Propionicimonas sp.]
MPRIVAATVAEHRVAQRRALLRAAADLVIAGGAASVTPTSVAERAGMARTSVYDYFPSREELLVAVALSAFEEWGHDLAADLDGVEPGLPQLRRYIDATMEMAADGRHVLATAFRGIDLSPDSAREITALHDALQEPLLGILAAAGFDDPEGNAPYIQAVIAAGVVRVAQGERAHEAAERIHHLIVHGARRRHGGVR